MKDAITACQQIKEEHLSKQSEEKKIKEQLVEEWVRHKTRQLKRTKLQKKQQKVIQEKHKDFKKQQAQKGISFPVHPHSVQRMAEAIPAQRQRGDQAEAQGKTAEGSRERKAKKN